MLFGEETIELVRDRPLEGVLHCCKLVQAAYRHDVENWSQHDLEILSEFFALIRAVESSGMLSFSSERPQLGSDLSTDCSNLATYRQGIEEETQIRYNRSRVDNLTKGFELSFKKKFAFEFSDGDVKRLQQLLNELREAVAEADYFDEAHRARLLRKLEGLQAELHKRVSDLDRFWGLVGEAGVVFGKFGKDAKPIFDRLREMTSIVWSTQSRAEELPSSTTAPQITYDFPPDDIGNDDNSNEVQS